MSILIIIALALYCLALNIACTALANYLKDNCNIPTEKIIREYVDLAINKLFGRN